MKNTIMLLLLLVMAILSSACGKDEAGASAGAALQPPTTTPDNSVTPTLPNPPVAGFSDHSSRTPAYGTNPTLQECQYIADNYAIGQNQTWYFGAYYAHGGTTQAAADSYNATHFLRLDRDGVVWRTWNGSMWSNQFLTNVWYDLGQHCRMHIVSSTLGIDVVTWDGVAL